MRRTIRLTERDLSRLVRRAINEMDNQSEMGGNSLTTSAMNTVSEFLKSNGGEMGYRNNDDIEKDLKALEYAIRIERNGLRDSNQTSGYKHRSRDEYGGIED
jgi:hypothetical protein